MDLMSLLVRIGADVSGAERGIESIQGKMRQAETTSGGFVSKLKSGFKAISVAGAAAVAGISAATAAVVKLTTGAAQAADRIDKMSQKIGISREAFQEMDFIASQSGTSVEVLQQGMKTLRGEMMNAADDTSDAAQEFKRLGIQIKDSNGKMRSQEDVMFDTLSALQAIPDETERAAMATKLFGRAGVELVPLLNSGTGSIEEMRAKAHELGLVLDDEAIDAGVKLTDTMDQVKRAFSAVTTRLGAKLMPIVQNVLEVVLDNMPTIQKVLDVTFGVLGKVVGGTAKLLGKARTFIKTGIDKIKTVVQERFGRIIDWIKYIPNAVKGGLRNGFDLKTIIGNILTGGTAGNIMNLSFKSFIQTIVKPALSKALGQLFGDKELGSKVAGVFASIYEHVGSVVEHMGKLFGNLKDTFFGVWEKIKAGDWKGVGQVLWNGIKSGFSIVGDWIKELVLGDDYTPDATWSDVGGKIWDAIKAGISAVGDWIKSLVMGDDYTPDTTWGDVGGKIWDAIKAGVKVAGDWIKSLVLGDDYTPDSTWGDVGGKIWDAIKAGINAAGDWIKSVVMGDDWTPDTTWSDVGGKIWGVIVSGISTGVDWITGFYNSVSGALDDIDWESVGSTIWDKIKGAFASVVNWFKGLFGGEGGEGGYEGTSVKDAILEIDWLGLGTAILGYIKSAFFGVAGIFKGFFSGVWTSIKTIDWAGLGEAMWFDIRQAFGKIGEWFSDTFKAPINIVIGFLNSMIAKVRDALNTVIDFINNSLNITIPSVTFDANPWSPNFGVHTDYKHPAFNWNPGIDRLAWSDNAIPLLARGGIVGEGGRAIVGEYRPEALRVVNGQAIVTPLGTGRFNTGDNFTFNVYAQPGQSAQEIALAVKRVFLREDAQRRAVYA